MKKTDLKERIEKASELKEKYKTIPSKQEVCEKVNEALLKIDEITEGTVCGTLIKEKPDKVKFLQKRKIVLQGEDEA